MQNHTDTKKQKAQESKAQGARDVQKKAKLARALKNNLQRRKQASSRPGAADA